MPCGLLLKNRLHGQQEIVSAVLFFAVNAGNDVESSDSRWFHLRVRPISSYKGALTLINRTLLGTSKLSSHFAP